MRILRTAECVTPKHPDKICDQVSDAILDLCLSQDPNSRVAVETMGGHGKVYVLGEITTNAIIDNHAINAICKRITGQDASEIKIVQQSPEIAGGVDNGGAGDQGIMVGYACDDNEEMIPQELYLARKLALYIYNVRAEEDGKTQITLNANGEIAAAVISFCHVEKRTLEMMFKDWQEENARTMLSNGVKLADDFKLYCNPAGDWNQGGFEADTGLTGRKLAVDNYGPRVPIGGGAFSGKDATKVDRSAAYMARRIATDLLKRYGAHEVMVKLAYSIGVAQPVMATAQIDDRIVEIDIDKVDLSPKSIIDELGLREPIFEQTAKWGHFGRKFNWDKEREIRGFDNVDLVVDWPIKE